MSALRERNTRSLAPGNQFELSPHNETLNPDRGWQVVTEPSDALREFVAGVQDHYVAEGWDFKDALTSPHHNLALVFTNPLRDRLHLNSPSPDFIKPEALEEAKEKLASYWMTTLRGEVNHWGLVTDTMNQLLMGTNLQATSVFGMYHEVEGFHFIKFLPIGEPPSLIQEGVAVISVGMSTVDETIQIIEQDKRKKIEEARNTFSSLNQRLDSLRSLQVPEPKRFF